jgi:mRNA deadenylase 3'-5' endonuclease subunit Ccr4
MIKVLKALVLALLAAIAAGFAPLKSLVGGRGRSAQRKDPVRTARLARVQDSGWSRRRRPKHQRRRGSRLRAVQDSQAKFPPQQQQRQQQRQWVKLYSYGEDDSGDLPVRILSYNVLGPKHGESGKHNYCPMELRKWDIRKERILAEIEGYAGLDVVCLQEVTPRTLESVWVPFMRKQGLDRFEYLPKQLPNEPKERDPDWRLGVATFWKSADFDCVSSRRLLIRDAASRQSWSYAFRENVRGKADGAVLLKLRSKKFRGNYEFTIVNAHLWWDPREPHIKSAQAALLCEVAQEFSGGQDNIVIAGDLNSVPELQSRYLPEEVLESMSEGPQSPSMSGVYRLLSTGRLSTSHPEHPAGFGRFSVGDFITELQLRDVYGGGAGGEDEDYLLSKEEWVQFTTKTDDFSGVIDYFFVSQDVWVSEVLELPLGKNFLPIPNAQWASDHLAVGVAIYFSSSSASSSYKSR